MVSELTHSNIQPSFAGGELSPSLQGRVDLARYSISLDTCRNFIVLPYGGISNRAGTRFVAAAKYSNRRCRLIPFVFSADQTYTIELGHEYIRFHRDGAPVEDGVTPVEVSTPWVEDDIDLIKYVQSADVLTLLHPSYQPRELRRMSETDWDLVTYDPEYGPFQDQNTAEGNTITSDGATGNVTLSSNFDVFSSEHEGTLISLRQVDMGEVSAWQNRANVTVGDKRYVDERTYEAVELSGDSSTLTGDNTPTHTEGEQWDGPQSTIQGVTETLGVKWRYLHSGRGIARITTVNGAQSADATVVERIPDTVVDDGTYRWSLAAWNDVRGYPSTGCYYQQRLVLANSIAEPQTFWMTETGIFNGFKSSIPIEADDAIRFTLASRQVNEIRHLVPLSALLALTSGAEWVIDTTGQEGLTPDSISAEAQNYRGVSNVPPLLIGSSALYIQSKGTIVRDLAYSFDIDGFTGNDLTIFSNHLFSGHRLTDWTFSQEPNSLVWVVRDDGVMLSMTYVREQEVIAWARHDTQGSFESVCSIGEGQEDYLYAVVKREVNGSTVRYIERMESRDFEEVEDFFGLDSGLTYDGRNKTSVTLTLTGGTEWTTDETLTLTASQAEFSEPLEGRRIRIYADGEFADVEIDNYINDTEVEVSPVRLVPESVRGLETDSWALMATELSGLDHLEGETVTIAVDGNVGVPETVESGEVTLQVPGAVVHAGLSYESDVQTLPISSLNRDGTTIRDKTKSVPAVGLQLDKSRGVFAARDRRGWEAEDDLIELKQREFEDWAEPTNLVTGYVRLAIPTGWDKEGQVFIRQADPLPLTILAIIPEVQLGGKP